VYNVAVVIALVNRKGGVGKSLLAVHLAATLHELGARTALVDLDDANRSCLDFAAGGHLPFLVTDAQTWDQKHARERWDHVVLDGYARADGTLTELAELAPLLIVPTLPDAGSLRVLARFLPGLQQSGATYRVLLNSVPPHPSRDGPRARASLTQGGVPLFETQMPRAASFVHAVRARRLAWDFPRGNRYQLLFRELAREVLA
jgi:chromosome partitioning protein